MEHNFKFWKILILLVFSLYLVKAHFPNERYEVLDNVKYSYGIFAPVGLTVGAYSWYIASLGLILGAIVLLYFSKGWTGALRTDNTNFIKRSIEGNPEHVGVEETIGNDEDFKLFWTDKIKTIAESFGKNK